MKTQLRVSKQILIRFGAVATACLMLAAIGFAQQSTTPQAQDAGSVISSMLMRYYQAQTLKTTIVHTVSALGKSQTIQTDLQFDRPSLLSIRQVRSEPDANVWIAASDGKAFSYPVPIGIVLGTDQSKTIVEPVKNALGQDQSVQDLLQAAADSFPDFTDPLLIMAGWKDAQKVMIARWSNLQLQTITDKNGVKDWAITGIYTNSPVSPIKGTFTMIISPDYDLLSLEIKRSYAAPGIGSNQAVATVDTWICQTTLNGTVDQTLFHISK